MGGSKGEVRVQDGKYHEDREEKQEGWEVAREGARGSRRVRVRADGTR